MEKERSVFFISFLLFQSNTTAFGWVLFAIVESLWLYITHTRVVAKWFTSRKLSFSFSCATAGETSKNKLNVMEPKSRSRLVYCWRLIAHFIVWPSNGDFIAFGFPRNFFCSRSSRVKRIAATDVAFHKFPALFCTQCKSEHPLSCLNPTLILSTNA